MIVSEVLICQITIADTSKCIFHDRSEKTEIVFEKKER